MTRKSAISAAVSVPHGASGNEVAERIHASARSNRLQKLPDLPEGQFGRLFPDLPWHNETGDALLRLGAADGPLEVNAQDRQLSEDNPRISAGWPFFGQLVAHNITHDRSPLREAEDISQLHPAFCTFITKLSIDCAILAYQATKYSSGRLHVYDVITSG